MNVEHVVCHEWSASMPPKKLGRRKDNLIEGKGSVGTPSTKVGVVQTLDLSVPLLCWQEGERLGLLTGWLQLFPSTTAAAPGSSSASPLQCLFGEPVLICKDCMAVCGLKASSLSSLIRLPCSHIFQFCQQKRCSHKFMWQGGLFTSDAFYIGNGMHEKITVLCHIVFLFHVLHTECSSDVFSLFQSSQNLKCDAIYSAQISFPWNYEAEGQMGNQSLKTKILAQQT